MRRLKNVSSKIAARLRVVATEQGYDFADLRRHYQLMNFEVMVAQKRVNELEHSKILQLYELPAIFKSVHNQVAQEGLSFIFDDFGDYVALCSTSPTLATAISHYVNCRVLMGTCDDVRLIREGHSISVIYECGSAQSEAAGQAWIYLIMLADLVQSFSVGEPFKISIGLKNENIDIVDGAVVANLADLTLGNTENSLSLTTSRLDEYEWSRNDFLHQLYAKKVHAEMRDLTISRSYSQHVSEMVCEYLYQGDRPEILLSVLCQRLHVSRATLHRKLAEEATSYSQILSCVRKNEATRLLGSSQKNIIEVSQLLGFSNVSSFNRFIKKHFDTTPSAFKSRLLSDSRDNTSKH
ncbi:hypothetical protein DN730_05530 [Marinomonas piezotolerans]|uniref:HTH araC/xylS-type domain-containing protein n=1 Tax=Marinomonas piezotolerans TaxID=2213058 RepID=A0A370UBE7_9GAMM|nr:helix-turn-helix transcriptional regulator [Marinomonas piezotolerans]RDL45078.1 hypothetical protein DN730_05530 [Marinomonas piezotolerans]